MSDLVILHRNKKNKEGSYAQSGILESAVASAYLQSAPVWRTCIRELYFLKMSDYEGLKNEKLAVNEEWLVGDCALQKLIEILCGLESPVVGETEVFGQFKLFVQSNSLNDHWVQFVLTKVKSLRNQFLTKVGSHSYGSLLRKSSKGVQSFSMLGAGHLVQEMLPWISGEDSSHIEILTRDTQKAKTIFPLIQVKNLYFSSASHQALVIAAPVSDQQILEILRSSPQTRLVFDFRGEDNSLAQMLDDRFFYKGLGQFFDDLKEIQNQTIQLVQMVKQEIKNLVNQYHSRLEHRPMGWDDLCA